MDLRKPLDGEKQLLMYLVGKSSSITLDTDWIETLLVKPLDDGGMGSLRLFPSEFSNIQQEFGGCVSDCEFDDADGIKVIASLYVDQKGQLFELGIWKTDFSSLIDIQRFHRKCR